MTWLAVYAFIKFWGPIATAVGLLVKAYLSATKGISSWANTLLDNHMQHIQDASERSSQAVVELASYHRDMLDSQRELVVAMCSMKEDLHDHTIEDLRVQTKILTGIEVLKAKVD